jgi:hypothetical protein
VRRQVLGPCFEPDAGETAVKTANAGLSELGDFRKLAGRHLWPCVVRVDQDGQTRGGFSLANVALLDGGDVVSEPI